MTSEYDLFKRDIRKKEIDDRFVAAGHRPEDPNCDHANWKSMSQSGRYCLDCDTCMTDPGD